MKPNCFRSMFISSLVISFVFLGLLQGCSPNKELDRATAQKLLVESGSYPGEVLGKLLIKESMEIRRVGRNMYALTKFEQLMESGLVKGALTKVPGFHSSYVWDISLTAEGQSFVRGKQRNEKRADGRFGKVVMVVTQTRDFGTVTGITYMGDNKTVALVEYTEMLNASPFGQLTAVFPNRQTEVVTKQATLRKFDDGWRISR